MAADNPSPSSAHCKGKEGLPHHDLRRRSAWPLEEEALEGETTNDLAKIYHQCFTDAHIYYCGSRILLDYILYRHAGSQVLAYARTGAAQKLVEVVQLIMHGTTFHR